MVVCPEGHDTEATDYCDVCGTPIGAAPLRAATPATAPPVPGELSGADGDGAAGSVLDLGPPPAAPTQTCPHCGALNVADALFCESCGYDFTTGALPLDAEPESEPEPVVDPAPVRETVTEHEPDTAREPEAEPGLEREEEAETEATPDAAPEPAAEVEPQPEPELEPAPAPEPEDRPEGLEQQAPDPAPTASHARPRHTPPSRDLADTWVVEVWIDPDWYAVQQTEEACPSAGVPDVVVVRRSVALIGRPSSSLGARPDVDAGADSAVSRRHAQLTSDGRRWWIEDLGSSNGTFVGVVGEPVPTTPLTPGQRVEIDRDDRIYVGAWTRLVLRQATESEQRGQG